MSVLKLGVLISGSGSNLQAIIDQIEAGKLSAQIALVVSNEPDAFGLTRARTHGLPTAILNHRDYESRADFDTRLADIMRQHNVDLVALAGFMRLLGPDFLRAYRHRVINIHPALLPAFPGTHVWQDQIDYGVKFGGCTVHFVDEGMDTGPIIVQAVVPVMDDDTAEILAARILKQEHRIYSQAIQLFAEDRLSIVGRRVIVNPPSSGSNELVLINPRPEVT